MVFKIFGHSLRLVFGNLDDALRVSGILYLLSSGLGLAVTLNMPGRQPSGALPNLNSAQTGLFILIYVVNLIVGIWIAVAWHRYVLVDEKPDSILPTYSGRRILSYFGYFLLLTLVGMALGAIAGVLFAIFAVLQAAWLAVPIAIIGVALVFVVIFRLSIVLPASSVEKPMKLRDAWEATEGTTWTILGIVLLTILAGLLLQLPVFGLLAAHWTFAADVWAAATGWVFLMFNICLATTMYGVYVEKRAIPS